MERLPTLFSRQGDYIGVPSLGLGMMKFREVCSFRKNKGLEVRQYCGWIRALPLLVCVLEQKT